MFETAELALTIDRATFDKREAALRTELLALQMQLRDTRRPVFVLINGVDGAGKGDAVNTLHAWLDPRHVRTEAFAEPTDEERARPEYWRFWRALAPRGTIGMYFGSWYTRPILDRVYKRIGNDALEHEVERIRAFEQTLARDGAVFVKLWFHLSLREQRRRFTQWEKKKETRWKVTKQDWEHHARYGRFLKVAERVLRETSVGDAPWTVIEATDARYQQISTGEALRDALRACAAAESVRAHTSVARASKAAKDVAPARAQVRAGDGAAPDILKTLDLTQALSDDRYDRLLPPLQARLHRVVRKLRAAGRASVVVLEGWDAAGKGGAIRRITEALDARDYRVIPIAAPTEEERAQHYLWRFWRHLPGHGKVTIYDRSYYGRVLVERVEGFARDDEWQRAYGEINAFEEELHHHGTVVVKLFLHIDLKEQMRRFKEREHTAYKQHKITAEDYRNRGKWLAYVHAVHDMVARTSTHDAPWHLVAANDKRFARIDALTHVASRLEAALHDR